MWPNCMRSEQYCIDWDGADTMLNADGHAAYTTYAEYVHVQKVTDAYDAEALPLLASSEFFSEFL